MAPMKLEDNMKERLEERRIEPTAAAWDRIEAKLEVAQEQKKSKLFLWAGIAASFIVGVAVTFAVLNNVPATEQSPLVEVTPEIITPEGVEEVFKRNPNTTEQQENGLKEQLVVNPERKEDNVSEPRKQEARNTIQKNRNTGPQLSNKRVREQANGAVVQNDQTKTQGQKTEGQEGVTTTTGLGIETAVVSENKLNTEVDALLKSAQAEVARVRVFDKGAYFVDAENLLLDAEAVVDPETFKDKVFKQLKFGIEEVVEAVVDRNN